MYGVRPGIADDLQLLERYWGELYMQQLREGMLTPVPADGFQLWCESLQSILGRFACLFIAEEGGVVVGFLAGRIRALPPHFGGESVGYISEVFVSETERGKGVGRALLRAGTDWFRAEGVRRLELNVAAQNNAASEFYGKAGWVPELVQMVLAI